EQAMTKDLTQGHNASFILCAFAPLRELIKAAYNGNLITPEVAAMGFKLDRVHVWAGEVADRAGGAATVLSELAKAGANLEYVYTRRQPNKTGTGVLHVAPVTGPSQVRAA